jgi:hypothetical protein
MPENSPDKACLFCSAAQGFEHAREKLKLLENVE